MIRALSGAAVLRILWASPLGSADFISDPYEAAEVVVERRDAEWPQPDADPLADPAQSLRNTYSPA